MQEEEEEEVAPRQEKMVFTVKLTQFDDAKKVQLIKAIKSLIPNMNLVQVRQSLCVFSVQCCFTSTETMLSCMTFFMEVLSIKWAYSR